MSASPMRDQANLENVRMLHSMAWRAPTKATESGQLEADEKGIPETSQWAMQMGCGTRRRTGEIADTKAGYVYDRTRQDPPTPAWGLLPRPGKAIVFEYPKCKNNRVVADVVRLDKGHTEGLEPNVTEALVKLIVAAPGGKIQKMN